jgi:succinyl-CoA synthetase beta subunit
MDLSEHLGKAQLRGAGIAVPPGGVADSAQDADRIARELGVEVALKAQVPAGKRGKAGAVRFAASPEEAAEVAGELLGREVAGFEVRRLLVEARADIERELYAAILNDAGTRSPLLLFSASGGMDIEELSAQAPGALLRLPVAIRDGVTRERLEAWLGDTDLPPAVRGRVAELFERLYAMYREIDAELVEINPLAVSSNGSVVALDAKVSLDPGARPHHEELFEEAAADAPLTGTPLERAAREQGFLLIELDGDVAILANGAGLTMTTMDAVAHYGGRPANFLEIGGDAYTRAVPALRLVLSNPKVRSLLINFCGAFARTDVMTDGVVQAIEELKPDIPISFSIHGTGEDEAIELVRERLGLEPHDVMDDAVREAIAAAGRAKEAV